VGTSRNLISGAPFDKSNTNSPLLEDFEKKINKADSLNRTEKKALVQEARLALTNSVKPGYEKLIAFLTEQEKRATMDEGAWCFAKRADYYNARLKSMNTTNLTADQIHDIGLREVARIEGEMKNIIQQVGFKGTLKEFFAYTKEAPRFYFPDTKEGRQQYLDSATLVIDKMRGRMDELFLTKPKAGSR
jgi:uncharacterized protein (DUF885 family)